MFIFLVSKIQSIGALIDFCGSLFFTILTFITPVMIYHTHFKEGVSAKKKALNGFILIFGVYFGGIGAYKSAKNIF